MSCIVARGTTRRNAKRTAREANNHNNNFGNKFMRLDAWRVLSWYLHSSISLKCISLHVSLYMYLPPSLHATQESPVEMFYKNNESDRPCQNFGRTKWLLLFGEHIV